MKLSIFKSLAAAVCTVAALSGCQDQFDAWNLETPVASEKANISILDFKNEFWSDSLNYCREIPTRADGSHYIISGRVISSDEAGNVFKSLYIQDETAVLPISINQYSLYISNRVGQEIVLDLTEMYAGKYRGMFQLGSPSWNESFGVTETSFMAPEVFNLHREYNGNPEPAKVDTITINDLSEINSDIMKWQGQLVRFNNATFANANNPADNQLVDKYHSSGYNQTLNVNGGTMAIRTSGYSTFWNMKLPTEACDVVGILGYYQSSETAQPGTCWQLILNDADAIMNIGNPTAEGIKSHPYTVEEAIAKADNDNNDPAWVKGYIVGTIAPEVTAVSSNADIQWAGTEPYIMDNYVVIAAEPGVRDYTQCLLVPLPAGSPLFTYGNLADNPDLAGRTLNIRGRFTRQMGMAYLSANTGAADSFEIEGVNVPGSNPEPTQGDGSEASPYSVAQAIANNSGSAWVKGYIVGTMNSNNNYTLEVAAPFSVASNVYIADSATETNTGNMLPIQLVSGSDIRKAVNLMDNPGNLGKMLAIQGSLEKYFSQPGLKSPTAYKLDGEGTEPTPTPTPTPGNGDGSETNPYDVPSAIALNNPGTSAWVKGYIVGTMNSNNNYTLEVVAPFTVASNVYLAASTSETNTANMLPVQLVSGTDIRKAVNLLDNPGNLGKELAIQGSLEKYFSQPGLKSPTAYKLNGEGGGTTPDPTPNPGTTTGDGSETSPYTCADVISLNNPGSAAWVKGYIVGTMNSNNNYTLEVVAPFTMAANVYIADSASETDTAKMVPVQLVSGSAIRSAVNLLDNPGNLGKELQIQGKLEKYFQQPGLKSPTAYKL
ncbi:MAG: hypothetical protein K2L05_07195 [Muribaculaceae bacterium]|nr:hypothetical protein [Muribaculaceae bacterium]